MQKFLCDERVWVSDIAVFGRILAVYAKYNTYNYTIVDYSYTIALEDGTYANASEGVLESMLVMN